MGIGKTVPRQSRHQGPSLREAQARHRAPIKLLHVEQHLGPLGYSATVGLVCMTACAPGRCLLPRRKRRWSRNKGERRRRTRRRRKRRKSWRRTRRRRKRRKNWRRNQNIERTRMMSRNKGERRRRTRRRRKRRKSWRRTRRRRKR